MKGKLAWLVFWALILVLAIVVSMLFIPSIDGVLVGENSPTPIGYVFFLCAGAAIIGLGVMLLVLTIKTKVEGSLKKFLVLTEASFLGAIISGILHNVISGLTNFEEPVFFLIATIVCPISFLVGVIGSVALAVKRKTALS